jgi:hypothetical protein
MLPSLANKLIKESLPQVNPVIGKGLAVTHMPEVPNYIDSVFRSVERDFPEGLKYLYCRKLTPLQSYDEIAKRKNYDVARSNLYMMEYFFQYKDEKPFSRILYLPFVGQAGSFYISGTMYTISPVLADRVLSIMNDHVFVKLSKSKITFRKIPYHFFANDRLESTSLVYGDVHKGKKNTTSHTRKKRAKSIMVHYLLCRYGVSGVFEKFCGFTPIVIGGEVGTIQEKYPKTDWVICTKKAGFNDQNQYSVVIPLNKYDATAQGLVAGLFYVTDFFSYRTDIRYFDDVRMWKVLLGHVLWPQGLSEAKLLIDIQNHMDSLASYIDSITQERMLDIGMKCNDFYDLLFNIVTNFDEWISMSTDSVSTMYGKELSILLFVCSDITNSINNLLFKLREAAKRELNSKKIISAFNENLKTGAAFNIPKMTGLVSTTTTSGDNMLLKVTNLLTPQTKTSSQKSTQSMTDPSIRLHSSIAEVGGYACLPKSAPDGRSRINPYLKIGPSGLVLRDPKLRDDQTSLLNRL